jgi:hypothetical protein
MAKTSSKYRKAVAVLMLMLSRKRSSGKLSLLRVGERDVVAQKEQREAGSFSAEDEKQRKVMLIMGCMHGIKRINAAIAQKAVSIHSPPPGDVPHGVEDCFGDDNLFNSYFQFRKHEVLCILHAMHLSGIYILCGR